MPKIISERCEFVKLCHINGSGQVFFETQCSSSYHLRHSDVFFYHLEKTSI